MAPPPRLKVVDREAITCLMDEFDPNIAYDVYDDDNSPLSSEDEEDYVDDGESNDPESQLSKWPCDVVTAETVAQDDDDTGEGEKSSVDEKPAIMYIWEYLGQEWRDMITALREVKPIVQPEFLSTELHSYQLRGVAKLVHVLQHGPLDGVILGDAMGLGKTIQAVTACQLRHDEPGCFNLVVTTRSSAPQFRVEILTHYKPESHPSILLVKSTRDIPPATDLIARKWDWVIMTYDQLLGLYKNVRKSRLEHKLQKASVYSDLFKETNSWIRHLIIDEVTNVLRTRGKRHLALKKLRYRKALLLSGTFIPDKWYEVHDILDLMPRAHPFHHKELFKASFCVSERIDKTKQLTQAYRERLVLFLLPSVVARPSSTLVLPKCTEAVLSYKLDPKHESDIVKYVKKFYRAVHMSRARVTQSIENEDDKAKALRSAVIAQQIGASDLIVPQNNDKGDYMGELVELAKSSDNDALAQLLVKTRPVQQDSVIDEKDRPRMFQRAAKALDAGALRSTMTDANDEDHDIEAESDQPKDLGDAAFIPGQSYDEKQWYAEAYGPEPVDKAKGENDDTGAHDFDSRQQRNEWLDSLRSHADGDKDFEESLFSPKVNVILDKIISIYKDAEKNKTKGSAKIIVFSKFLRFLDVLEEAMRRHEAFAKHKDGPINPFLFHGQLNTDERRAIISSFSSDQNRYSPLFITQQAGGCALNIAVASRVIICEPWWCENDRVQAIARCWRQGQDRQVHVYDVVGLNSLIDQVIFTVRSRKDDEVQKLVDMIRVMDDNEFNIPIIYHAPISFPRSDLVDE